MTKHGNIVSVLQLLILCAKVQDDHLYPSFHL